MKGAITTTALALVTAALIVAVLGDTREISFRKPVDVEGIVFVDHSGHTYVVFLARNRVRPELYLAWVADSLYDVTAASVEPVRRGNRRHENLSAKAFLDILRQASR